MKQGDLPTNGGRYGRLPIWSNVPQEDFWPESIGVRPGTHIQSCPLLGRNRLRRPAFDGKMHE